MVLFRIARVVSSILPIHGIQVVVCILQALYNLASIEDDLVSVGQANVQVALVFVRRAFKPYKSNYRDGGLNVQGSGAHRTGRCRSGAGQVSDKLQAGSWYPIGDRTMSVDGLSVGPSSAAVRLWGDDDGMMVELLKIRVVYTMHKPSQYIYTSSRMFVLYAK